ncbi:hypothetical protein GcM3_020025 [Golovinomyces cichoracearum]|uniref:Uncharacterized protein n=1 Tax=Golovinomyces cichoracearum TaxID=62708 RepID=A0A420J7V3_9PEZI|nr:hypothetical protein GcM3_020025 [Golovinomyces cichoracearum]
MPSGTSESENNSKTSSISHKAGEAIPVLRAEGANLGPVIPKDVTDLKKQEGTKEERLAKVEKLNE